MKTSSRVGNLSGGQESTAGWGLVMKEGMEGSGCNQAWKARVDAGRDA